MVDPVVRRILRGPHPVLLPGVLLGMVLQEVRAQREGTGEEQLVEGVSESTLRNATSCLRPVRATLVREPGLLWGKGDVRRLRGASSCHIVFE